MRNGLHIKDILTIFSYFLVGMLLTAGCSQIQVLISAQPTDTAIPQVVPLTTTNPPPVVLSTATANNPIVPSTSTPTAPVSILPTAVITATQIPPTLAATPTVMTEYQGPNGRVSIAIPEGGRYIVVGDSLSYGSTMLGNDTYTDICLNRHPFAEELAKETGILSTSSLDRGDSMKTPFYSNKVGFRTVYYCSPPPGTPLLSTAVGGSNTTEWLTSLIDYPVLTESLEQPNNKVVLLLIGADIFAAKIGKPAISADQYQQNIGQIVQRLVSKGKVVYLAMIPHVQVGSFIAQKELDETNRTIDEFNQRLKDIIEKNGYLDAQTGQWVDYGFLTVDQDGLQLQVISTQAGPQLDQLSDQLQPYTAKDGLHFHPEGYDLIGKAWADALKAPIRLR